MKRISVITFLVVLLISCFTTYGQEESSTFINKISSNGNSLPEGYVPPLISNGSLSMLVDYRGCQGQSEYVKMVPTVYWAGRRYGPPNDALIPFGHFDQILKINGKEYVTPTRWEQTLDDKSAVTKCINDFGDELTVETEVFNHLSYNLIAVKKKFIPKSAAVKKIDFSFMYYFTPSGSENIAPRRVISQGKVNDKTKGVDFLFSTDGYKATKGEISLFADQQVTGSIDGQIASLSSSWSANPNNPVEITFYLIMEDSMDGSDYESRVEKLQNRISDQKFSGLLASHRQEWAKYWDESFVKLPDERMEKAYNTAQYHLRANATKWSFPVGIFTTHWAGRYFGWDEMFCYQALASSNHLDISKRCPEFRFAVLPKAQYRVAHYGKPGIYGARYPWETLEDGGESAPIGFWYDHVFHMSNIALSSWLQYLFTADNEYLKNTGYPVIRECARFYYSHMLYRNNDGTMYIGKCTDLERLGPDRQNPYMTACGVICTFENAAASASILQIDQEEADQWKQAAQKLKENLPTENGMYVPFLGCKEKSVASLGGLFPYQVFDSENTLQRNAVYDFVNEGKLSGNMYPVGKSVCAWYAGWMAAALALLNDREEPGKLLSEAAKGAGCFAELFEINELQVKMHPWFSTASGNYIYALNQMLLHCSGNEIVIAPAVPESWNSFAYKLPCYGNMVVEVKIANNQIAKLVIIPGDPNAESRRVIAIPGRYVNKNFLSNRKPLKKNNGFLYFEVVVKGKTTIN